MPPIEIGPTRRVGAVDAWTVRSSGDSPAGSAKSDKTAPAVVRSEALDAGDAPPVDVERVKVIKNAIERGTYPVVPTKIADAVIAAQLLLRSGK